MWDPFADKIEVAHGGTWGYVPQACFAPPPASPRRGDFPIDKGLQKRRCIVTNLQKRLLESVLALAVGLAAALFVFLWAGSAPVPARAEAETPSPPQPLRI